MKFVVAIFLVIIIISACHSNADVKNTSSDSTINKKPEGYGIKQLAGVFYDTLPCADCPGIATKLYLRPDMTFVMERQYVGKGTFYETGTWLFQDSLLQLTGEDSPQQFKIMSHAALEVLDAEGKEINSHAGKLMLHRNNIPFVPVKPVPVEGIYNAVNDTMVIHICSMNRDYQATLAPSAMIMTSKYKQASKEGKGVYAQVAGHFELRPSLSDTTTQDYFVIEKFIRFDSKKTCK